MCPKDIEWPQLQLINVIVYSSFLNSNQNRMSHINVNLFQNVHWLKSEKYQFSDYTQLLKFRSCRFSFQCSWTRILKRPYYSNGYYLITRGVVTCYVETYIGMNRVQTDVIWFSRPLAISLNVISEIHEVDCLLVWSLVDINRIGAYCLYRHSGAGGIELQWDVC